MIIRTIVGKQNVATLKRAEIEVQDLVEDVDVDVVDWTVVHNQAEMQQEEEEQFSC